MSTEKKKPRKKTAACIVCTIVVHIGTDTIESFREVLSGMLDLYLCGEERPYSRGLETGGLSAALEAGSYCAAVADD
jgi:hypothetical protein